MTAAILDVPQGDLGPLDPEHFVQLRQSRRRAKKIRGAVRFASISGWTTLLAGLLALPFAIGDGTVLALALALCAVGYHELALRKSLRRLDRGAPGALALNQVILAVVIIAYAAWQLVKATTGEGALSSAFAADPAIAAEPQLANITESLASLERTVMLAIYGGLIAGTVLMQGLGVRYYMSRRKHLCTFIAETPPWVLTLHRTGVMG
ncbi:MAG: hypothetical protein DHS20C14_19270 [Phycisphaeraceae bacterium]|nr:MAG: hypothetical protein DHS20C14_19270 [Phycisphaeraceae bacterium]